MLCRNCYREIPDGTKFCPECGTPTGVGVNGAPGASNALDNAGNEVVFTDEQIQHVNEHVQEGLEAGSLERHTLGDGSEWGQYQQPQYQQGQIGQGGAQQGQYPQGQYQQGQYHQEQMPSEQGAFNQVPPQKQGQSGMSIAAMILGILTCTAFIGFTLGIIDLAKNSGDGKKHGGSIFAVIWGGILIACVLLHNFAGDLPFAKKSVSTPTQQSEAEYTTDSYDDASATDEYGIVRSDSYSEPAPEPDGAYEQPDNTYEQQNSDPGVVDPQFKAALDSYEEFIDEYVKFLNTYTQTSDPMAMLSEYSQYMTKYSELMEKLSKLDQMQDQMSQADLAYYIDWNARIQKKLLEISSMGLN